MTTDANLTPGQELSGIVVRVTGAARNIGQAVARALAAGGDVRAFTAQARD